MADSQSFGFEAVFQALKEIISPYAAELDVVRDDSDNYYLNTRHIMKNKKPLFFAAVQIRKNYVSFHLMPVYVDPSLLKGISTPLRNQMQGKSCFNFKKTDEPMFAELSILTRRGYESYESQGFGLGGRCE